MVQRRNRKMQIFVDADACPVVAIIEKIAKDNSVPVMLLCDTNHVLSSTYSKVVVVGAGADAVDYKLISICHKGDIVVSQDYGVAAMALGKGAYAIHQSGKWYTDDNIDQMLMERHLSKKARRSSRKCHVKGPKKRTEEDDERFAQSFEKMLLMVYLENQRMPDATEMNDICKSLFTAVQSLAPKTEYEEFYKIVEKREKSYEERILRDIQNGIIIETLMAKKHKKTPEEKAAVAKQKKQQRRARRKQETRDNLAKEEILQDDRFFVIAGYTSGGAPYGVTWEEMGLKPWEDLEENN